MAKRSKQVKVLGLGSDNGHNGRMLANYYVGQVIAELNRIGNLASGKVVREGTTFGVSLTDKQIDVLQDVIVDKLESVCQSLRNGVKFGRATTMYIPDADETADETADERELITL